MSLVEVTIAAGILLVIALGIVPLLTHALGQNVRGWEATRLANGSKDRMEGVLAGPFASKGLTVPEGDLSLRRVESWTQGVEDRMGDAREGWHDGDPQDRGRVLYQRAITVRQFGLADLENPVGYLEGAVEHHVIGPEVLAGGGRLGGTFPGLVHLKQVEIAARTVRRGGALGAGQRLDVRTFKAF